jgi:hypothetical protein
MGIFLGPVDRSLKHYKTIRKGWDVWGNQVQSVIQL